MKLLKFVMQEARGIVIFAVLAGLISGLSSSGAIAVIHKAIGTSDFPKSTLALAFAVLCVVVLASEAISQILLLFIGEKKVFELRLRLSKKILSAPLSKLEKLGKARLLATLSGDVGAIVAAITFSPLIFIDIAIILGCLIYMGWLSWPLLIGFFIVFVVGILSYQIPVRYAGGFLRAAREEQDDLYDHMRSVTDGTKEMKLHYKRRQVFFTDFFEKSGRNYMKHRVKGMGLFRIAGSWGNLLFLMIIGVIVFTIPNLTHLLPAWMAVNKDILTGYTLITLYMMMPVSTLMNITSSIGEAIVAFQKVENLGFTLDEEIADKNILLPSDLETAWNTLDFQGVMHCYNSESKNTNFTLGPINLSINAGETIFLAGGNGSGKTTLAKVLTGLYSPDQGNVMLDKKQITDHNREQYRQNFSVVFSDFYLFENLLGLETGSLDQRANDYLVKLQIDQKVQIKEGAFSTTDLSQGQRKRLALLTAYLEDRPFHVFDEWAADQDPYFREIFYTQILPELKNRGKTILVITHDDRYYHLADRFVKLDYGTIEFDGDYESYLQQKAHAEVAEHPN